VVADLKRWASATLQAQWWQPSITPLATLLRPAAALYGALARRQRQHTEATRLPVPVIVVGNLIVGGAGKTPTTVAVVQHLQQQGWRPGVLSRGHGRRGTQVAAVYKQTLAAACGDEPLLIHLRTGAPTWVGADRVAAGRALLHGAPEVNIIVSDDGLQHHRLHRDVQVIVFDERGIGNSLLLPAGPLREPLGTEPPPHSVVLYNAAQPSTPWPGHVAARSIRGLVPLAQWWAGDSVDVTAWRRLIGEPVVAAAGIAWPERFFAQLRSLGLQRLTTLPLPDHARWNALPWPADTADAVITEKDAVKLRASDAEGATRIWVAPLDFLPPPAFFAELNRLLPR
jgi:tetraacyldisaccharide 4'-kinase